MKTRQNRVHFRLEGVAPSGTTVPGSMAPPSPLTGLRGSLFKVPGTLRYSIRVGGTSRINGPVGLEPSVAGTSPLGLDPKGTEALPAARNAPQTRDVSIIRRRQRRNLCGLSCFPRRSGAKSTTTFFCCSCCCFVCIFFVFSFYKPRAPMGLHFAPLHLFPPSISVFSGRRIGGSRWRRHICTRAMTPLP